MSTDGDNEAVVNFGGYEGFSAAAPAVRTALLAMGKAVRDSGLDERLSELVKLRISALNGCHFCFRLHLDVARRAGLRAAAIEDLPVWRESSVYDARERAALGWAEVLTAAPDVEATERARATLLAVFTPSEVVFLTSAIANIHAWNRIARGLAFPPTN